MYKIIGADGKEYVPASTDQLRQWIWEGRVNAQTRAQASGNAEWKPLADFPEFHEVLGISASVPPPISPPVQAHVTKPPGAEKKLVAGIVALIPHTGCLGIHKFILGYTGAGITMLLVTLLTCGIGGVVMWVISLIEGITYLTKSDDDFVRTYVLSRKEWF